ncbi:ATP-binding cassette domain-containing protein [Salinibacterium sp. SWN167]|uniref:ATP-binding cassette domain-containing protein n=1 Tax=Salinibacterium sp. SWN167 TaxID=2792054 RepID=UPI0018CDC593|nr:ATP-binding cassette domain-containing protein [Salinibacterium sp. SWN167]MBH0083767.1 ATP-binding cassette domain-containing protein [Salinibacterium sp. SWN167]
MTAVLQLESITKSYGGVRALDSLSLHVAPGEVLGVIGPNGAGKSTLIGVIGGALTPNSGTVTFDGRDISTLSSADRARLGIGRTYQIPRPFTRMTVADNVRLAATNSGHHLSHRELEPFVAGILERLGLTPFAEEVAGKLPLLRRKRLELARALALKPRVLLLDEIGAGLVRSETEELISIIQSLRTEVESMVLIEHVMDVISQCCDRTAVLDFGKMVTVDETPKVLADPVVASLYLGSVAESADTIVVDESKRAAIRASLTSLVSAPNMASGTPLLTVDDVWVRYGGLNALKGVSLSVNPGECIALLGANGAGKTTMARSLAGAVPLTSGTISFAGKSIAGLRPDEVTALGIAQCMEGRKIFGTLSIEENLIAGGLDARKHVKAERLEAVYSIFPILKQRRKNSGTALSGGQQQMLAIGRALMSAPTLLVFDEISLGLSPIAVDEVYEALGAIRDSGVSMIVVEQSVDRALGLADRAMVLGQGEITLEGKPAELLADARLLASYLG